MKKFPKILSAALAIAFSLNLAACGTPSNTSSSTSAGEQGHVHNYETTLSKNSLGHWYACTGCSEKKDYEKHKGGNATCGEKNKCEVCNKEYGNKISHKYGDITDTKNGKGYLCGTCGEEELLSDLVDFVVEVETGREPVILQLTDPQIMYSETVEETCYSYVRETIQATNPDLILVTGDLTYGRFDSPDGGIFTDYVNFMETFEIPWAPVFGNHDNEILKGVDWQCQQLESAEYCLFKQNDLTGNGNYSVGVLQGNKLLRTFYMLDSNGCGEPSEASKNGKNGIKTSAGFGADQISWYATSMQTLKKRSPETKFSMAYHIQTSDFALAYEQYEEFDSTMAEDGKSYKNPLFFDEMESAKEGDIGFYGRPPKSAWTLSQKHAMLKSLGVDSIFVGHEHCNSASVVYDGIRYQYGQKSSACDRYNALTPDGKIKGGYTSEHVAGSAPLIGGTAFALSQEKGEIVNPYIYYCGNPFVGR